MSENLLLDQPFCKMLEKATKKLEQMNAGLTSEQAQYLLRYAIAEENKKYGNDGVLALIMAMPE